MPGVAGADRSRPQLNGALAGMLAPLAFVVVLTVDGWLRADYDPASMFLSELSLGPDGWIQIANFLGSGAV